jgi:hypothetical protein
MKGELTGGCLCGAVRYTLREGFRFRPYACHCTDCQSRTGSAFSEHMLFVLADLSIEGELDAGDFIQPSGARSRIVGCARCKARIYATNDEREGMASLRCGTLDDSAAVVPAAHLWVKSKQPWIGLPTDAVTMDEQPRSSSEWLKLVGPR